MVMEYEILETETFEVWNIRIYCDAELCGKLRLGTVEKDLFQAKLDELGWTERT